MSITELYRHRIENDNRLEGQLKENLAKLVNTSYQEIEESGFIVVEDGSVVFTFYVCRKYFNADCTPNDIELNTDPHRSDIVLYPDKI